MRILLAAVVLLAVTATPAAGAGTHVTFTVTPGALSLDGSHVTDARGTDLGYRVDVAADGTVSAW